MIDWQKEYTGDETPEVDPAVDALLSIGPAHLRDQFEPLLSGLFAQIRANIGNEQYAKFTRDLQDAGKKYLAGDKEPARELFAQYGFDIAMFEQMAGAPN